MENLILAGIYLNPILAIVFCLNLVAIIKKVIKEKHPDTSTNTFWMTVSAVYIIFSISWMILL
ncbi:hypothetical protein BN1080_01693 [Planococcus massiliensis]|uniref:PCZ2.2 n=1 Tax=Planococcus massiliensis TaxID=1499687 RepID=A0A098EKA7_9BACL|nr:hypothetical protein [Planococcus massiliensis]CEG22758.1 hypothetical protein BN1080_01693 [Planococcus massiliensis]